MACVHLVHMKNTSFEVSVLLKYMCVFFFPSLSRHLQCPSR